MALLLDLSLPMRIPAPDRLNLKHVAIFVTLMFVGQELEGTDFVFASLTAVYTVLWATAFNATGGIRYASGAYIFFNGFLNVIVGLGYKVLLGQAGDRNLQAPRATMVVYCVGMAALFVAAIVARALRTQKPLLAGLRSTEDYRHAAIICLVVGVLISGITTLGGGNSVVSMLRQINKLPQLAIMLATIYEIRRSNGARSLNFVGILSILFVFALGLISFGKEGMLLGFAAYIIAAVIEGYNFPRKQLVGTVVAFAFFSYYLVPYSQLVRNYRVATVSGNLVVAIHYLSNLQATREEYKTAIADFSITDEPHLYDEREGFMDRLIILPADDNLINYTNKGNVFGFFPTYASYANLVPHFLWASKPEFNTGNVYAHELGELADEDNTTGISFSASADAYHQGKWLGLLLLLPFDIFLYFIITDTVVGSARWAPWVLIPILDITEIGSQGGLSSPVYLSFYGILGVAFMIWVIKLGDSFVRRVSHPPRPTSPSVQTLNPISES